MYYRRWTRMFVRPAFKYFTAVDVVDEQLHRFTPLLAREAPALEYYRPPKKPHKLEEALDTKLINRLFLRYPDLKYEPISKKKYGAKPTSFSYALAFLTEQKALIKQGYTIEASFHIVEERYQRQMQRKLDQTLLSRGLALGNRARSLLTVYQQQAEYESRLKADRTRREAEKLILKKQRLIDKAEAKYNAYLDDWKKAHADANRPSGSARDKDSTGSQEAADPIAPYITLSLHTEDFGRRSSSAQEYAEGLFEDEPLSYSRMFTEVAADDSEAGVVHTANMAEGAKRGEHIQKLDRKFSTMFEQLYEVAGAKDRLEGLTDEALLLEIRNYPNRIRANARKIFKFLRSKDVAVDFKDGEVVVGEGTPQYIVDFLQSPRVRTAILYDRLNYEKTELASMKSEEEIERRKQALERLLQAVRLSPEDMETVTANKRGEFEFAAVDELPTSRQSYKLLESAEERLLRLEIKYLEQQLANRLRAKTTADSEEGEGGVSAEEKEELRKMFEQRRSLVQLFRRLKFRLEKRHLKQSQGELLFKEHEALREELTFEQEVEFEELKMYLRRKTEDRRLTAIQQVIDSRINKYLDTAVIPEAPQTHGDVKVQD